jgi:hypothetical protein
MIYFAAALLVVALGMVVLRYVERRSARRRVVTQFVVGIIALAVGISSTVQVYRTGDAGAHSVWGDEIARLQKTHGD